MSYFFLVLYIVCTFIRPQDWVPFFFNKPLVNILSLLAFAFLVFEQMSQKKLSFAKVPQNSLMLGLYFAVIMSHLSHTYIGGLVYALKSFMIIFILFFLLLNGVNGVYKFKISIWLVVFLIMTLVFQGIYQIENGYGWAGQGLTVHGGKITEAIERINWVGIFSDPNDLALVFVMAIGIALAFLFGKSNYGVRVISVPIILLLFYGIYLTNSRGGYLALLTTVYYFFIKRTGKLFWGSVVGGVIAFGVLILGPSRLGLISISESSAFNRVELWYQGILMLKSNPLFGAGYDMFMDALPQTAHNSFILAAAELGFIGLFFWMALIYSSLKGLSIVQDNDSRLYNYALGLQSSLVGFCAAAFFLSRTYVILPYFLFAFSGAAMNVAQQNNSSLVYAFNKRDAVITFFMSIGVLSLSYLVIKVGL